jgi:foldase protein PrsA
MNNKLKKLYIIFGMVLSISSLTACSNSELKQIVSFDGGSLTAEELYNNVKLTDSVQEQAANLTILKVFNKVYGNKISKDLIDTAYNEYKSAYSTEDAFNDALKENGYTDKTFRDFLKSQLAYEYGINKNITVSDDEITAEFENYYPDQEIKLIVLDDNAKITSLKEQLNDGADFDILATENSLSDTIDYTLLYNDQVIPESIKSEIYKLKDGEVSNVLSYNNETYGITQYYLVKMVKSSAKPTELTNEVKEELVNAIKTTKAEDTTITDPIIKKVFSDVNVNIMDDDFKTVFSSILNSEITETTETTETTESSNTN